VLSVLWAHTQHTMISAKTATIDPPPIENLSLGQRAGPRKAHHRLRRACSLPSATGITVAMVTSLFYLQPRLSAMCSPINMQTTKRRRSGAVPSSTRAPSCSRAARAQVEQHVLPTARQIRHVSRFGEGLRDVLRCLDATKLDERGRVLERLRHHLCGL